MLAVFIGTDVKGPAVLDVVEGWGGGEGVQ